MNKYILSILILFLLNGCGGTLYKFRQQSKFNNADKMYSSGNKETAIKLLKEISYEKGITGITDEAMFRLALVYLSKSIDTEYVKKAEDVLLKLQKDYPASQWAKQSYPLMELIIKLKSGNTSRTEMDQEINLLKQENKKLKQNIEKLKTLDIEIEKRHRN